MERFARERKMGMGWQWQAVAFAMMVLSRAGGDQPLESDLVDAGAWHVGENVQAAIAHYGERVGRADAVADDYRHLSTALRFSGRLQECAAVMHRGVTHVPAFATGSNFFTLANVLRASGRAQDSVGAYQAAIRAEPVAANYYMQLGMTLQYHALEHVLGDTNVEKLFQTAVRLCIVGDEVWMQSSLLHLEALLAKARAGFPPALIEAGNRYRMLVAMPGAAWLRWGGALGVNLPNAMLDAYNRRALPRALLQEFADKPREHLAAEEAHMHARAMEAIASVQHPAQCRSVRAVVFRLENNIFGLGAQIHLLSLTASYAFANRRTLLAAEQDGWWYAGEDCPSRSFQCYFEPLSSCTVTGAKSIGALAGLDTAMLPLLGEHDEEIDRVVLASVESEAWLKTSGYRTWVPEQFASMGLLWWRTQLVANIFRPREHVREHVRGISRQLSWPEPWGHNSKGGRIVGVHVRHGDKIMEEAPRVPLSEYVAGIRRQLEAHGGGDGLVFVATDSQQVLSDLAAAAPDLRIMAAWDERRNNQTAFSIFRATHTVNATRYALDAITNLLLLQRCGSFVGTFSSNFGRLAYELQLAFVASSGSTLSRPRAPVSMDFPWYADP